jgi:hypothetical protein
MSLFAMFLTGIGVNDVHGNYIIVCFRATHASEVPTNKKEWKGLKPLSRVFPQLMRSDRLV